MPGSNVDDAAFLLELLLGLRRGPHHDDYRVLRKVYRTLVKARLVEVLELPPPESTVRPATVSLTPKGAHLIDSVLKNLAGTINEGVAVDGMERRST